MVNEGEVEINPTQVERRLEEISERLRVTGSESRGAGLVERATIFDRMADYLERQPEAPNPLAVLFEARRRLRWAEEQLALHTGQSGREYAANYGKSSRSFWEGNARRDMDTFEYVQERVMREVNFRDPLVMFRYGAMAVKEYFTGKSPLLDEE